MPLTIARRTPVLAFKSDCPWSGASAQIVSTTGAQRLPEHLSSIRTPSHAQAATSASCRGSDAAWIMPGVAGRRVVGRGLPTNASMLCKVRRSILPDVDRVDHLDADSREVSRETIAFFRAAPLCLAKQIEVANVKQIKGAERIADADHFEYPRGC
jgi:hypothetical protein